MSYTVGQQVVLNTVAKDANQNLVDATMALLVTRPDGTTLNPTVSHDGLGLYSATVPASMAGPWLYVWTASGAAVGVDDGQFEVTAAILRVVSLADVKKHLNKTDTNDDVELQDFIDAAQEMINEEVGDVLPRAYTERYDGGVPEIALYHGPLLTVQSVTEYNYGTLLKVLTPSEYRVDPVGIITRILSGGTPSCFNGSKNDVAISYTAGLTYPVPANIRLAAKELTAHLWRNTQLGRTGRQRASLSDDASPVGLGFSMPTRVKQLLGGKRGFLL